MRFMIIVKVTNDSEAGVMPEEKLIAGACIHSRRDRRVAEFDLPRSSYNRCLKRSA